MGTRLSVAITFGLVEQLDLLGNHSLCVCGCLFPADLFIYFLDYTVCDGG